MTCCFFVVVVGWCMMYLYYRQLHYELIDVPADGRCLYHALALGSSSNLSGGNAVRAALANAFAVESKWYETLARVFTAQQAYLGLDFSPSTVACLLR